MKKKIIIKYNCVCIDCKMNFWAGRKGIQLCRLCKSSKAVEETVKKLLEEEKELIKRDKVIFNKHYEKLLSDFNKQYFPYKDN